MEFVTIDVHRTDTAETCTEREIATSVTTGQAVKGSVNEPVQLTAKGKHLLV
jgi:hypothetical protein